MSNVTSELMNLTEFRDGAHRQCNIEELKHMKI